MDFDEYEYLEKTVEDIEPDKPKETLNGDEDTVKSDGREGRRKHKHDGNSNDIYSRSKQANSGDEKGDRDKKRGDRDRKRGDRDRKRGDRSRKSGDSERDRDDHDKERSVRDRKNRSSHHRLSSRDVARSERGKNKSRHEDREREERNGRVRDRDRGRERGLEKEKDHKREKRVREPEKDIEKDKESGRERSQRSRRHSERQKDEPDKEKHRERERTFERERSRDSELRVKETDNKIKEPDPENRKENREEVADPEVDLPDPEVDPERDQRTVFAYEICLKADERDVYEFFSRAGKVRDVRLIMDRNSKRSRGVGYIEFYNAMAVPMAIALSGQTLLSHPVMVKPSESEKNLVQSTTSATGGAGRGIGPYSGGARRLYVGNLHYDIKEDQLRQVFESFGSVELVQLPLDQETGHCKGYGFVQFARLEDARAAESLNGQLEIAGRAIKVSAISDQAGMQDIGANPGDFDNDEGGDLSLNAQSRAILMQKLDGSGTTSSVTGTMGNPNVSSLGLSQPVAVIHGTSTLVNPPVQAPVPPLSGFPAAGLPVPTIIVPCFAIVGVPSECLLLKNMFDPNSENWLQSEQDFDLDIKEDIQDECSRYGTLKHIFVDKNTSGFVYLQFDSTQAAISAQRALHGRWCAGKMITATFMMPQNYDSRFPIAN